MKPKYKQGNKIGNLKILEVLSDSNTNRRKLYKCLCKCGNTTIRSSYYLKNSTLLNCGCEDPRREKDRENAIIKRLYHFKIGGTKDRIKKQSSLNFDLFKKMIKLPCFYCGIEYSMVKEDIIRGKKVSNVVVRYNGIDRINSNLGYTSKNCVPCCSTCNMGKRLMAQKDFLDWIKRVYKYNKF